MTPWVNNRRADIELARQKDPSQRTRQGPARSQGIRSPRRRSASRAQRSAIIARLPRAAPRGPGPSRRQYARHPTSIQPLCFWDHSSWTNVSYCSRDCERTLHRGPFFIPLAAVLADLMGGNAPIRAICCAHHSRTIDLIDERRAHPLATAAKLPSVPRQILRDIPRPPNSASRDD